MDYLVLVVVLVLLLVVLLLLVLLLLIVVLLAYYYYSNTRALPKELRGRQYDGSAIANAAAASAVRHPLAGPPARPFAARQRAR